MVAMAALAGVGAYFVKVGLERADQWAGVLGLFVAVAGLGVAIAGLRAGPGRPCAAGEQPLAVRRTLMSGFEHLEGTGGSCGSNLA
ncbi:hypothetical protein ACFXJ8_26735 [Nonomuraea sp. NPDC059194]|uniref:hypothetical protein n=1 Tax=Nonomuraea sp. NPDC059194 TaxID=3346764 RepID=UPI00368335CD